MIAVLKNGVTQKQIDSFCDWIKAQGVGVHVYNGEFQTVVGLIGDTTKIDAEMLSGLDIVDSVKRISDPFKSTNRQLCYRHFRKDYCRRKYLRGYRRPLFGRKRSSGA